MESHILNQINCFGKCPTLEKRGILVNPFGLAYTLLESTFNIRSIKRVQLTLATILRSQESIT